MFSSYLKKKKKPSNVKSNAALDLPFFSYMEEDRVGVEAYKNNSIVHRCVSLIATSASHIPWHIYKDCGDYKKVGY